MASLSNTELSKFRNGRYRWQTFLEKVEAGELFELEPKSAVRLGTQKSVLVPVSEDFYSLVEEGLETGNFSKLTHSKFYLGNSETTVGLTNLQKTEEFGRSGGCAGGSDQTEKVEALTAILCAVKTGGKSTCSNVDFSQISLDKSWYTSLSETVENITESEFTADLKDYHYQDDLVEAIQRNYNRVRKGTRFAYKQLNKWNPADGEAVTMKNSDLLALHDKRLRRILNAAVLEGVETIILGAFGCGAFRNNPEVVALANKNVIKDYLHAFKNIDYAIYCGHGDDCNYKIFERVLRPYIKK